MEWKSVLIMIAAVIGYLVLNTCVLPKLGVPT